MELTAVHASDGRYYDATLLEVKAASVVVCFQGESESATVDIDTVRTKQYVERKRKPEDVEAESGSQLPKGLEILPDDSEDAIEKKKKKLKMFKRQEKRANDEKQGEGRRTHSLFTLPLPPLPPAPPPEPAPCPPPAEPPLSRPL